MYIWCDATQTQHQVPLDHNHVGGARDRYKDKLKYTSKTYKLQKAMRVNVLLVVSGTGCSVSEVCLLAAARAVHSEQVSSMQVTPRTWRSHHPLGRCLLRHDA